MRRALLVMTLAAAAAILVLAQSEKLDYAMLGSIRDEGLNRSQVMDHVSWLSDVYGPRLTGSPGIQQASEWTMKKFREWGLANVHQERWSFGKGGRWCGSPRTWSSRRSSRWSAFRRSGRQAPRVRSPPTSIRVQIANEADFEKYRGKLAGKNRARSAGAARAHARRADHPADDRSGHRRGRDDAGARRPPAAAAATPPRRSARRSADFYVQEGVVAVFDRGSDSDMAAGGSDLSWQQQHPDGGTIFPNGSSPRDDKAGKGVPVIALAVEHYNRMIRVLDKNVPVKVELNVETRFYDETTPNGFNTIAEIPGTDLASEIVLLGAHFDSHPYATGATDNATGSGAMMEAVRILKAVGAKPRRTIRIGLWGGEEQGLLGSRAYVRDHLADVETMALKPEHAKLSAVFNSDNGSGKVRGIWLQSNMAARPIFEAWMAPLHDLGVTTIGPRTGRLHRSRLVRQRRHPGVSVHGRSARVQLAHAPLDMDTFDRVQRDDMVQQATVIAVFAYNAAMRDEKLPRKALPAPPKGRGTSAGRRSNTEGTEETGLLSHSFEGALRMHRRREQRAEQQEAERAGEGQLPVAGRVDDVAERDRRQDRGERRAGVHHARRGAGELAGDVHRDRPHRPDHESRRRRTRAPSETMIDTRSWVRKTGTRQTNDPRKPIITTLRRACCRSPVRCRMRSLISPPR